MKKKSTPEYFWSKIRVDSPDKCWEPRVPIAIHKHGYPMIRWQCKTWNCRNLAFHLTFPTVDIIGVLRQQCQNKLCCNPHHMYDSGVFTGTRICHNCSKSKDMGEFTWAIRNKRKDTVCKSCNLIKSRKYLADPINREKNNIQRTKHRPKIKDKLNEIARNDPKRPERQRKWDLENHARKMWLGARKRSIRKNVPFSILPEHIIIPQICPVLGIPLIRHVGKGGGHSNNSPTIDRIIPNKGYVEGNIRVISFRANTLKNNASLKELELIFLDAQKINQP